MGTVRLFFLTNVIRVASGRSAVVFGALLFSLLSVRMRDYLPCPVTALSTRCIECSKTTYLGHKLVHHDGKNLLLTVCSSRWVVLHKSTVTYLLDVDSSGMNFQA